MSFYLSFSVVFPLCSYILIGVLARKMKLLDDAAVSKMNGMAFRLLFPIMMFTNMQAAASALKKGELSVVWVAVGIAVLLFALLLWRGITLAAHAPDRFGALLVVGFVVQVALQAVLNIAVVTNTIPNTGISLPFFSSGGTSLMMLLGEMGIVLSVSRGET